VPDIMIWGGHTVMITVLFLISCSPDPVLWLCERLTDFNTSTLSHQPWAQTCLRDQRICLNLGLQTINLQAKRIHLVIHYLEHWHLTASRSEGQHHQWNH